MLGYLFNVMLSFQKEPERRTDLHLSQYEASRGEYFGTVFQDALIHNPTASIGRMLELNDAEKNERVRRTGGGKSVRISLGKEVMEPDQANIEGGDIGLKFDKPVTRQAFEIMKERKLQELLREETFSNRPDDLLTNVGGFGVGLAATFLDPINLALIAVPYAGGAKLAQQLGRASMQGQTLARAGLRAGYGAMDGFIGSAIAEVPIYMAARQEQSNYNMTDSLTNLAFGTIAGAGFGVGLGAAGDFLDGLTGKTRNTLYNFAMNKALTADEIVDVDTLIKFDENFIRAEKKLGRPVKNFEDLKVVQRDMEIPSSRDTIEVVNTQKERVTELHKKASTNNKVTLKESDFDIETKSVIDDPDIPESRTKDIQQQQKEIQDLVDTFDIENIPPALRGELESILDDIGSDPQRLRRDTYKALGACMLTG